MVASILLTLPLGITIKLGGRGTIFEGFQYLIQDTIGRKQIVVTPKYIMFMPFKALT